MFFYLAPIQGITDCSFRGIFCRRFGGVDAFMAPFVSAVEDGKASRKLLRDVLPENNREQKLVPQILGNNADFIAATANAIKDLGYDEVNINIGCPYPMVTKKNRGAGLLRNPDSLDRLLDATFSKSEIRISIKTRIGFDSPDEIIKIMEVYNRYPMTELIVHPRVASQMYSGRANLEAFVRVVGISKHKLVYNGDICCPEYFKGIESRLPDIDRWMIGRAAASNPFIFEMIRNDTSFPFDACERFFAFHDELFEMLREKLNGPGHLLDRMKGFWRYFCLSMNGGSDLYKKICKIKNESHYNEIVSRLKDEGIIFKEITSPLQLK